MVSPQAALDALQRIRAPRKRVIEIDDVGDLSSHVLAGDILSLGTTDEVVARIVEIALEAETTD